MKLIHLYGYSFSLKRGATGAPIIVIGYVVVVVVVLISSGPGPRP